MTECKIISFQEIKYDIINCLQDILRHERRHFNFYLQAVMEIRGIERSYLKSFLEKEMMGELEHIRMFGDKIVSLGGIPTLDHHGLPPLADEENCVTVKRILTSAIDMEKEVLRTYWLYYPKSKRFAKLYEDMSIALMLEENIEHTTHDMEEMKKML